MKSSQQRFCLTPPDLQFVPSELQIRPEYGLRVASCLIKIRNIALVPLTVSWICQLSRIQPAPLVFRRGYVNAE